MPTPRTSLILSLMLIWLFSALPGFAASGTLTFTSAAGFTGTPDTASDGQGGSTDIAGITIQVYAVSNSSGTKKTSNGALEYHQPGDPGWNVTPPIVTWVALSAPDYVHGMIIKSSDGTNFKLSSLNFHDWGGWDGGSWTIEAFENGDSKGTGTFDGNTDSVYVAVAQGGALNSTFNNIDEVRIYRTDLSGSWFGVNNIVIADPVVPNTAPTFVGASTLTLNQNASATEIKDLLHASDSDASQTLTWSQSVAPNHGGTLNFASATASSGSTNITPGGTITYQPANGYSGSETFTVQVSDGTATASRIITVTINPTYTVTYNGNGNTGGTVPTDSTNYTNGATVTVAANSGSLTRTGYTFAGWNTQANGSGTNYAAGSGTLSISTSTNLYAKWVLAANFNAVSGGIVYTLFGDNNDDEGKDVAIQSDGKIVVAGVSYRADTATYGSTDISLVRYNTDGTVDTNFGTSGFVRSGVPGQSDSANSVAIQSDGKIVVAGGTHNGTKTIIVMARFNTDGTLDASFGTNGIATSDLGGLESVAQKVLIQSDGKILVAGTKNVGYSNYFTAARYNPNGTLDTSFGTSSGYTSIQVSAGHTSQILGLALQSDGKILIAGAYQNTYMVPTVLRLTTAGAVDTTFGSSGFVVQPVPETSGNAYFAGVAVQSDGTIVLSGYYENGSGTGGMVYRLTSAGALDNTFGSSGRALNHLGSGIDFNVIDLLLQPDGKIVIGGGIYNSNDSTTGYGVARYSSLGALDAGFGSGGTTITNMGAVYEAISAMALQSDGNIVLAGNHIPADFSSYSYSVVRYDGTGGSLDSYFNSVVTNTLGGTPTFSENGTAVVLDSDVQINGAYNGDTLTLQRNGGQNSQDVFGFDTTTGTPLFTVSGGSIQSGATTLATFTNTGGALTISFVNATQEQANDIGRRILYSNNGDAPPASVQIDWNFSATGSGSGHTTVSITAVNDSPTGTPSTTGTTTEGQTLTAGTSGIADTDGLGTFSYQWQVSTNGTSGWSDISGATASAYALAADQVGKYVRVRVSFTDGGGTPESVYSPSTVQIAAAVQPPTVTNISPSSGPTLGGTSLTITGSNLTAATAVRFGSTNAASFTVDSATQISATSPAGTAGTADVTVTTAGGTSATSANDQFIYVAAPSVTGIAPTNGPKAGGTTITITGANLAGATAVKFGNSDAASYTVDSDTQITATSPAGPAGTVHMTVSTVGGTSTTSVTDQFTYVAEPVATAATSITFAGFTANWGDVGGATGYFLDVATDSGFSSFVAGYNNKDVGNLTADAVTGLTSATTYYYRIRAYSSGGTGGNSNTITVLPRHTVTPSTGGHGSINPASAQPVVSNGTATFTLSPDTGYHIESVTGCGGTLTGSSFTTNPISGDCTVTASFAINSYTISGSATGHGTISCTSPVNHGANSTCILTPDPGYRVMTLTANSGDILADLSLDQVTLANVTEPFTVSASFTAADFGGRAVTSGSSDAGLFATTHAADGTQHLVYEREGSLYYRSSTLVSGNWSEEETIAVGHDPAIALRQDGIPLIAFLSNGQIRTTTRSGGSWSTPVDTGVADANYLDIAVDGNNALHLVYTALGADGYDDILYSSNNSGSFGTPAAICNGAYASGSWTFCRTPLIKVDGDGNYHIAYSKQQISSRLNDHDPQWMIYTTNRGGGFTINSHDLNPGSGTGTPQLLARGSFSLDPLQGYSLAYGNDMEAAGLWLAVGLESGTWTESAVAVAGTFPAQANDDAAQTRHLAYTTPDGRLNHVSRTADSNSAVTPLAPSGDLPAINPVKRAVLYRAQDSNGIRQIYQVGIDALVLMTPASGSFANVIPGQTTEKEFTLSNSGSKSLSPSQVRTEHPGYTFEIGMDNCSGTTLAPGASCVFTVRNSRQDFPGTLTDNLTVTSDDPVRGTITLPLSQQVVEPFYPLQLTLAGSGTVTASATGQGDFTCSSGTCSRNYDTNSIVNLTAQAPAGYSFTGFTFTGDGSACCRETSCSLTITGETRVTATFSRNSYVISTLPATGGTIVCEGPVSHGNSGSCTLTPDSGLRIEGVGGSCGGTLNGTSYTTLPMTGSCTVEAVFTQATQRNISVTLGGSGAGSVYSSPTGISCASGTCSSLFDDASAATLTAVPDSDSTFGGWSGACTNSDGPCELTLTQDRIVTAAFSAAPKVKVGETGYTTLAEAYSATSSGAVIKARTLTFTEALILDGIRQVRLEGGFNAPYDCNTCGENTLLRGSLTIEKGSLILENLTIR